MTKTKAMRINDEYKAFKKEEYDKMKKTIKIEKAKMKRVKEYINLPSEKKWPNKKILRSKRKKQGKKVKIQSKNLTRIVNKYKRWEKLFKYEEDYIRKKLIEKADIWFARYIRYRDKENWCITNTVEWCRNKVENACHWISRWYYSHRWDEDNVYWWCVSCNAYHQQEHWMALTMKMVNKYWQEWVEKQLKERHKKKPTIDKLLDIIEYYKSFMEKVN